MFVRRLAWLPALTLTLAMALPAVPVRAAETGSYLPDDTELVVSINVRRILDSAVVKKYLLDKVEAGMQANPEAQQILTAVGLDPLKDVTNITLAGPGGVNDKKFTVLVQGHFDLAKIHATADQVAQTKTESLKIHKHGDFRIYEGKDDKGGKPAFIAVLDKDTVVLSPDKAYVVDAIERSTGKKPSAPKKNLQALLGKVDTKQSIWLAAVIPQELKSSLPKDKQQLAAKLNALTGGITLDDGVKAALNIQTTDSKAALEIRQTLMGLQGLGIFAVTTNEQLKEFAPLLTDILNSFKFTSESNTVTIAISFTGQQIEKGLNGKK